MSDGSSVETETKGGETMTEEYSKRFCFATWLSGFFAFGALIHLIRLIFKFSMVINNISISLSVSAIIAVVLGMLSGVFLGLSFRPREKSSAE